LIFEKFGTTLRRLSGRSGIEALGRDEKDCRMAAPKEEQFGKSCESNEWERTSQMTAEDFNR
jgi:hypothetical protein